MPHELKQFSAPPAYHGSSLGRFMSPDWSAAPSTVPYASLADPQSLNLYSYVLNNPLSSVDPNGHDWFYVDNKWQWQQGSVYHDKDGNATKDKGYAGLLVAEKYGTDKKTGASLYHLTLYNQDKVVANGTAEGFSGGNGFRATKNGNYMLNLDHRDATGPNQINPKSSLNNPYPFNGIQRIHDIVEEDSNWQITWPVVGAYGYVRAYLDQGPAPSQFVHGQQNGLGWTHGCLSYGKNVGFGEALWNLPAQKTPAAVGVPVEKPSGE